MEQLYINGETVHNWTTRYQDLPYFEALPTVVRIAIKYASVNCHRCGHTVREAAQSLVERFPKSLQISAG